MLFAQCTITYVLPKAVVEKRLLRYLMRTRIIQSSRNDKRSFLLDLFLVSGWTVCVFGTSFSIVVLYAMTHFTLSHCTGHSSSSNSSRSVMKQGAPSSSPRLKHTQYIFQKTNICIKNGKALPIPWHLGNNSENGKVPFDQILRVLVHFQYTSFIRELPCRNACHQH